MRACTYSSVGLPSRDGHTEWQFAGKEMLHNFALDKAADSPFISPHCHHLHYIPCFHYSLPIHDHVSHPNANTMTRVAVKKAIFQHGSRRPLTFYIYGVCSAHLEYLILVRPVQRMQPR